VHSLELNIHQRILSDLASNNNASPESTKHRKVLIASKVQTRVADDEVKKGDDESTEKNGTGRVYMVRWHPSSRLLEVLTRELPVRIEGSL
jgi:hypothetical protein